MIRLSSLLEHQDKKVYLENNTKEKGASKNGAIQGKRWGRREKAEEETTRRGESRLEENSSSVLRRPGQGVSGALHSPPAPSERSQAPTQTSTSSVTDRLPRSSLPVPLFNPTFGNL